MAGVLAGALVFGTLLYWSPRYWPLAAGIATLAAAALVWASAPSTIELPGPAMIPVLLIAGWGFLQILTRHTEIPSVTLRVSVTWLMCGVAFFLGSQILRQERNRRVFLRVLLWSLTALAVEALLQLYSRPVRVFGIFPADESVVGTMIYTNYFAALMELGGPLALYEIRRGRVLAGGLAFAAMFAATVAGASRAGFILMLAEFAAFIAMMAFSGVWQRKSGALAVVSLVVLIGWASGVAGFDKLWDKLQAKHPYEIRHELLDSTMEMIRSAPVAGHGLGTWRSVYPKYATLDLALVANEAHNDWAQWASDGGVPFMLLMGILAAMTAARATTSLWGLGLLCVLLHCCVDYPMRCQPIAFLWFTLAGALASPVYSRAVLGYSVGIDDSEASLSPRIRN